MVAGLYTWETGKFDVFHVNPPLVRSIASMPVPLCDPQYDWKLYSPLPSDRSEFQLGTAFCEANGARVIRRYFTLARWFCIPFCVLGATACYRLAADMFGQPSGRLALILWCSSPLLLGWGATICPDLAAAAVGVAAIWTLRRWLLVPNWPRALLAGVFLGLLLLTKLTWIVALALWPALWLAWRFKLEHRMPLASEFWQVAVILLLGLCVTNLGYAFEGSLRALDEFEFVSKTLGGVNNADAVGIPGTGNRFAGSWLGKFPMPLPASMVQGMDTQRHDFERGLPSYLRGEWAEHGWWYYYFYALGIKVPLGTWCLAGLAFGMTIRGHRLDGSGPDEMVVLVPGLAILILVSSQTGFSVHSRYVIPTLPLLFIWISKIGRVFDKRPVQGIQRVVAAMVVVAVTWTVGSSLWACPHSLSYFNELTGGPKRGGEHLVNSNIDWGQDLVYLKDWLGEHPGVMLDGLALHSSYPPTLAGIPQAPSPPLVSTSSDDMTNVSCATKHLGPKPGWYALSVNRLHSPDCRYQYFLDYFDPVGVVAYSIYIYHITLEDANRVRREMGLPLLSEDCGT